MEVSLNRNSIMVVAGEVSGDVQGGKLVAALKRASPDSRIFGIGGDRMREAGMDILFHVREMSFLGFSEVVKHIPFIRNVLNRMTAEIRQRKPAVVVLIDYPGFNLRLAKRAKALGCRVVYYISPQVWAWGKNRVNKIANFVDLMIVIFPFEEDIYIRAGVPVKFVGHPMLEGLESDLEENEFFSKYDLEPDAPTLGLLPGSRFQEVKSHFSVMVDAFHSMKKEVPELQAVTGLSPTLSRENYIIDRVNRTPPLSVHTYDVMKYSDILFVASGTATLESACFGTPLIVVYRVSALSWLIGRMLVNLEDIGLVNVVAGKRIAPELLQADFTSERLAAEGLALLRDDTRMSAMRREFHNVRNKLGETGASEKAAALILEVSG